MYYECRKCKIEEFRGVLPGTTCGILLAIWGGICASILGTVVRFVFPDGLGWWWLLAGPVIFAVSMIPGAIAIHLIAITIEWILISVFPCRNCRSHQFSFGRTHGFGL